MLPERLSYRLSDNESNSVLIESIKLKRLIMPASSNTYSPLLLALALAACGGGGGGGSRSRLGKPKVKVSDDGSRISVSMLENTTLISSESSHQAEKLIEKQTREIASNAGKSPGKATISDIVVAADGKSATLRQDFSNPEFSFLSANVKIELVGDDAKFFRIVLLNNLASRIEFIKPPDYERPSDTDANNYYIFRIKSTYTYETGETVVDYTDFSVRVNDVKGDKDPNEEGVLTAFDVAENTSSIFTNNAMTLTNLSHKQKVTFQNLIIADDGKSATMTMVDKTTGRGSTITIRLVGEDADKIEIVKSGKSDNFFGLKFRTAPDYENRADSNNDNVYKFSLQYSGLQSPETTDFHVKVTNLEETVSSQGRSSQSVDLFHHDFENSMPESEDVAPQHDML